MGLWEFKSFPFCAKNFSSSKIHTWNIHFHTPLVRKWVCMYERFDVLETRCLKDWVNKSLLSQLQRTAEFLCVFLEKNRPSSMSWSAGNAPLNHLLRGNHFRRFEKRQINPEFVLVLFLFIELSTVVFTEEWMRIILWRRFYSSFSPPGLITKKLKLRQTPFSKRVVGAVSWSCDDRTSPWKQIMWSWTEKTGWMEIVSTVLKGLSFQFETRDFLEESPETLWRSIKAERI